MSVTASAFAPCRLASRSLPAARRDCRPRAVVERKNAGASLVDLGDGVLRVEFHSKMNAIGADTIQMLQAGVQEASKNFAALVVGNEASNFTAGANLMLVLLEAQEENWDELDLMVRAFQQATMALRYADVPVVVAPAGLALGGGCEIALHARPDPGGGRNLHWPGRGRRRPDSCRRRHEGDDARARRTDARRRRSAARRPARLRVHRLRQGLDQRGRTRSGSAICGRRRDHDEPRSAASPTRKRARCSGWPTAISRQCRARPFASAATRCWRR